MHRASIICCSLLINNFLIRGNDTLNYFWILARDVQILMCNYTDVRSGSGTVCGFAVDLRHHVSSCFSFWGKDKLIRLSCSYNYFCSSPFSMPSLSLSCSQPQPRAARVSIPEDMTLECLSRASADWGGGVGNCLRFNTIFQIKLRN